MEYRLRPARMEDLQTVLTWIGSPEAMRLWGGAALVFPGSPEAIWAAIGGEDRNAHALVGRAGELAGFGQILFREPNVHLARIIVAPEVRGQGLGRVLCRELMRAALKRHHPQAFTLNVYPTNTPALALYRSLGFEALPCAPGSDSMRMHAEAIHAAR